MLCSTCHFPCLRAPFSCVSLTNLSCTSAIQSLPNSTSCLQRDVQGCLPSIYASRQEFFTALTLGGCILNSCRTLDTAEHRNHKPQAGGWLCISSAGTWTSLIQQGSMPAAGVRKWPATTSDTSVGPGAWASSHSVGTVSSLAAKLEPLVH